MVDPASLCLGHPPTRFRIAKPVRKVQVHSSCHRSNRRKCFLIGVTSALNTSSGRKRQDGSPEVRFACGEWPVAARSCPQVAAVAIWRSL